MHKEEESWSHSLVVTRATSIAVAVPGDHESSLLDMAAPAQSSVFIMCLSSSLPSGFSHGFTSLDFTSPPF